MAANTAAPPPRKTSYPKGASYLAEWRQNIIRDDPAEHCSLNNQYKIFDVTELQRVTLYALQADIVAHFKLIDNVEINGTDNDPRFNANHVQNWQELQDRLHGYCDAVRDYEYMKQCSRGRNKTNPFILFQKARFEDTLLRHARIVNHLPGPKIWEVRSFGPRFRSGGQELLIRFFLAVAGGLALLVPMLVMVLIEGELVNLVTTSIAILTCALVVWPLNILGPRDVLTITAAYASIWVVFVGTQKIGHFRLPQIGGK